MPVEPIKTRRLYQEVADQLSRLIAQGEFRPGQRLPSERDLAISLQVSRPTIREAMIALEIAGTIEIRTGSGIFVLDNTTPQTGQDIGPGPFELMQARIHIEGEAAAIAAAQISDLELEALSRANMEMEQLVAKHKPADEIDMKFHQMIGQATRNSAMAAAVDQLWQFRARMPMWSKLHEIIREIEKRRDWTDDRRAVMDHREIIEALRTRSPAKARRAMQAHLKRVRNVLMTASKLDLITIENDNRISAKE